MSLQIEDSVDTLISKIFHLFRIVDRAKSVRNYAVANAAFAVALHYTLEVPEKYIKIYWETQDNIDVKSAKDLDNVYYDLLTISDGLRSICIPVPLLKDSTQWFNECFKVVLKKSHNRRYSLNFNKPCEIIAYVKSLYDELITIEPNVQELAKEYLESQESNELFSFKGDCSICNKVNEVLTDDKVCYKVCSVQPNYPQPLCPKWQIKIEVDADHWEAIHDKALTEMYHQSSIVESYFDRIQTLENYLVKCEAGEITPDLNYIDLSNKAIKNLATYLKKPFKFLTLTASK